MEPDFNSTYYSNKVARGTETADSSLGDFSPDNIDEYVLCFYRYWVWKVIQLVALTSALPDWHRKQKWCSYHRAQTHGTTQQDLEKQKEIDSLSRHLQFDAVLKQLYKPQRMTEPVFFGLDRNLPSPVRHSDDWMDQAEMLALCNALGASDVSRPSYTSVAQPKASPYVVRLGKVVPTVRVLR